MRNITFGNIRRRMYRLGLPSRYIWIILAYDDDLGVGKFPAKHSSRIKPIHLGHRYIHHHNIRPKYIRFINSFDSISGFTNDPIRLWNEQRTNAAPAPFMVINDQDAELAQGVASRELKVREVITILMLILLGRADLKT